MVANNFKKFFREFLKFKINKYDVVRKKYLIIFQ